MSTLQLPRIAGIVMLILAVLLIVAVFTAETPSTEAEDFPEDFESVVEDEARYLIGQAVQVAVGLLVAILGAALYVYFRGRDRFLSLVGFTGFLLMAALFTVSSAAYVTAHDLADDLAAEETLAGEAEVLEIGRVLVLLGDSAFFLATLCFAIGLLGFGLAIVGSRSVEAADAEAMTRPTPAWTGWIAVAAGVFYLLSWLSLAAEVFFIALVLAFLLTIVWYLSFGIWMLRSGSAPATLADSAG